MEMKYDYSKLRGRIIEKFGTQSSFAEFIKWQFSRVSNVLNNKSGLSQDDILIWCNALDIPIEDIFLYFFAF